MEEFQRHLYITPSETFTDVQPMNCDADTEPYVCYVVVAWTGTGGVELERLSFNFGARTVLAAPGTGTFVKGRNGNGHVSMPSVFGATSDLLIDRDGERKMAIWDTTTSGPAKASKGPRPRVGRCEEIRARERA